MTDTELTTYFARAGKPEQWYKVHDDEEKPGAGGGAEGEAAALGDNVLRLSPRAVSLYSHTDTLALLPDHGARPTPHPNDTMYGLRDVGGAGAPRPIVNILATTVEVVKAATEAGEAARARSDSGPAASPQPFMRTSDGGVVPDTETIKHQTSSASRGSRTSESGTGGEGGAGGAQGDATDALLNPALSSKVLEHPDGVREVARAQRALDDDIVHVDDEVAIRPPPPAAASGAGRTPVPSPPAPSPAVPGGSGAAEGVGDATPASTLSEATATAAALWPNGEGGGGGRGVDSRRAVRCATALHCIVLHPRRRRIWRAGEMSPRVPDVQHAWTAAVCGPSCARGFAHGRRRHVTGTPGCAGWWCGGCLPRPRCGCRRRRGAAQPSHSR